MTISITTLFISVLILFTLFYLEIRGRIKQKQCTKKLNTLMEKWRDNHDLNESEKQYLVNAIKIVYNPLSAFKLMYYILRLSFTKIKISQTGKSIKEKNPSLYAETMKTLNTIFVCTNPTLFIIIWFELLFMLMLAILWYFVIKFSLSIPSTIQSFKNIEYILFNKAH